MRISPSHTPSCWFVRIFGADPVRELLKWGNIILSNACVCSVLLLVVRLLREHGVVIAPFVHEVLSPLQCVSESQFLRSYTVVLP